MQHIDLAYSWRPHHAESEPRNRLSPLRNPLMDLLNALREAGSIGAAAKSLGLSYRHVWGELKRWEQAMDQTLIVWEKGHSARLTEFAHKLLWAERQAQARLAPQISVLQAELEKTFSVAFDPHSHALPIYASHDDGLVLLREHAAAHALHLDLRFCGSVDAIRALNEGRCTVAGFHAPLNPQPHTLIARSYKPLLQTGNHKLIGFALRSQGLMIAPGNPFRIRGWMDLLRPEIRLVNRSRGTGTRLLLDNWLEEKKLVGTDLHGYSHEESSHSAVAACIAAGQADVGLGIASAAQAQGLDFLPLMQEAYWLVCHRSALESSAVQALRGILQDPSWQQQLSQLMGYTVSLSSGDVQSLKNTLPWWHFKTKQSHNQG